MGERKIYHRDLKFDNIMISFKNERYFELMVLNNYSFLKASLDFDVVIIDFGCGKNLSSLHTNSTTVGNSAFWAPEGKGDDDEGKGHPNSDIFSVAAIFVHFMCPM